MISSLEITVAETVAGRPYRQRYLVASPVCGCGAPRRHVPRWECCGLDCKGQSMYWLCEECDDCELTAWPTKEDAVWFFTA